MKTTPGAVYDRITRLRARALAAADAAAEKARQRTLHRALEREADMVRALDDETRAQTLALLATTERSQ